MVYSEFVPFGEALSAVHNPMVVACVEQVRDHYFNGDYGVASKAAKAANQRLERLKNLDEFIAANESEEDCQFAVIEAIQRAFALVA